MMSEETRSAIWHGVWNVRDPAIVEFNGCEALFDDLEAYEAFIDQEADFVAATLNLGQQDRLLDLGCGTGIVARRLAHRVRSVLALDYSEHALGVARERHSAPNIDYRQANLVTLDVSAIDVDKACAVGSMHYLDSYETARSLLRALLARGVEVLVMDVPDTKWRDHVRRVYDTERYSHLYFDEEQLRRDFANVSIYRGLFPTYANDAVRFSFHLKP